MSLYPRQMPANDAPQLPAGASGFYLHDLIEVVRRRRGIVLACAGVAFLFSAAFFLVLPRDYEARMLVMVQAADTRLTSSVNPHGPLIAPEQSVVLSEAEILRSQDLARAVVDDLKLDADARFMMHGDSREDAVLFLSRRLSVKPLARSLVIAVSFRHPDAEMAAKVLNRLGHLYQEKQIRQKIEGAQNTAALLNERLKTLSDKLRESSQAVEEYRARENLIDGAQVELTSQQISEVSSQIVLAQADLAAVEAKNKQLKSILQSQKPLDGISEIARSELINLLKRDEAVLLQSFAEARTRYGRNHPRILAFNAEIAELRRKKEAEIARIADTMNNDVLAAEARVVALQKNLDALEQKRRRENAAAIGLRELEREAAANKMIYETFLNKYKEASILGDVQKPDTRIISTAHVPVLPAGPPRAVLVLLATLAGLVVGLVGALVRHQLEEERRRRAAVSAGYHAAAAYSAAHSQDFDLDKPKTERIVA